LSSGNDKELPQYAEQLETLIKGMLEPLKGIPFSLAMRILSGCEVLPFRRAEERFHKAITVTRGQDKLLSEANRDELDLEDLLARAVKKAATDANERGIVTARPNEAGNRIEPFMMNALVEQGLKAHKPLARSGKKRAMGYPDIAVDIDTGFILYIDCKTYSAKTKSQGMRAFYMSPSADPKVTKPGAHVIACFEMEREAKGNQSVFRPTAWAIYDLYDLQLKLKREFNADNPDIYRPEALIAEGKV